MCSVPSEPARAQPNLRPRCAHTSSPPHAFVPDHSPAHFPSQLHSLAQPGPGLGAAGLETLTSQASFADHAANGHGTLRGVVERVPYLQELGVDMIWLSPAYESPQADMGYDISKWVRTPHSALPRRYATYSVSLLAPHSRPHTSSSSFHGPR